MDEKEWDKEFSQKITDLTGEIWTGRYDLKGLGTLENKIFEEIRKDRKHQSIDKLSVGRLPPKLDKLVSNLIRLDRKHQKSEMLKRVPSVSEIAYSIFKAIKESVGSDSISKAVHKLVEDKLK